MGVWILGFGTDRGYRQVCTAKAKGGGKEPPFTFCRSLDQWEGGASRARLCAYSGSSTN